MLILAGVSINAIVGEDGILAKATNATLISEEVTRREALDMILLDYNSSEFLGAAEGMHKFLSKIQDEGQIGNYAITTDEDYAIIKYDDERERLESTPLRMVSFISSNYKKAYHYHAKGKSETEKLYLRLLLVTDYVCGMTDSYAKRLYQELKAIV